MAETSEEKTETASKKKIRDGRQKGQVVTAADAVVSAAVAATLLYICSNFGGYIERVSSFFDEAIIQLGTTSKSENMRVAGLFLDLVMRSFITLLGMAAMIAVVSNVAVQGGFVLSFESVKLDFNRLNPVEGFLRLFKKRSLITVLVNLLRIMTWTSISGIVFMSVSKGIFRMVEADLNVSVNLSLQFIGILITAGLLYLVLVVATDIMLQKNLFADEMKMTKSEVKQERKQSSGDPTLKQERKSAMKKDAESVIGVPKSTFIAVGKKGMVGIYYEHMVTPAPIMTLRVGKKDAKKVFSLARKNKIPIVLGENLVNILQNAISPGEKLSDSDAVQPFVQAYTEFAAGNHI